PRTTQRHPATRAPSDMGGSFREPPGQAFLLHAGSPPNIGMSSGTCEDCVARRSRPKATSLRFGPSDLRAPGRTTGRRVAGSPNPRTVNYARPRRGPGRLPAAGPQPEGGPMKLSSVGRGLAPLLSALIANPALLMAADYEPPPTESAAKILPDALRAG